MNNKNKQFDDRIASVNSLMASSGLVAFFLTIGLSSIDYLHFRVLEDFCIGYRNSYLLLFAYEVLYFFIATFFYGFRVNISKSNICIICLALCIFVFAFSMLVLGKLPDTLSFHIASFLVAGLFFRFLFNCAIKPLLDLTAYFSHPKATPAHPNSI